MKPIIDAGNLIACSACAKAKAKCDKRLPTCSRCLYKRLKCEPRPPRRYPETFQFLQSQAQAQSQPQPISPPSSTTPSPPNQTESAADEAVPQQANLVQTTAFDGLQWHQPSLMEFGNPCPGDLNIEPFGSAVPPFDPNFFAATEDMAMDYDFSTASFGARFPQDQTPPSDPLLPANAQAGLASSSQLHVMPLPPAKPQAGASSANAHDEDWPCLRCNPPSDQPVNPRAGGEYLRQLEETLNDQSIWNSADFRNSPSPPHGDVAAMSIEPVQENLRDKLMVISQGFLSRARDVHRTSHNDSLAQAASSAHASFTGFFILPPPSVLEAFLRIYASRVEPYIPFFPASNISLSKLVASNDEKSSILLVLLMIAQGAMGSTLPEARHLASGLVETCRICMFDIMEKNVQLSAHPVMLRCALLYLHAAAWSGNKWHMDLSAAQLRMYISMLRHARLLDARKSSLTGVDAASQVDAAWRMWQKDEALNRLTYSWVILDQEMNLFHDRQPDLDINELNAAIPDRDELWNAPSAEVWLATLNQSRQSRDFRPQSLSRLFNQFMSDELGSAGNLSLTDLRLLLHPLQALIYHLNKSLVYFFNSGSQRLLQRLLTQLEEVQYLLKQWYTMSCQTLELSHGPLETGYCNMVIFHLTNLNAITYFPDIERLARGEISTEKFRESLWAGKRCAEESAQIWAHCGQVIRYYRQIPASSRPYWWSASIYRIALCLWATSLASHSSKGICPIDSGERIAVDALPFDHPSIVRYLRHQDAIAVLSQPDGSIVWMESPCDIIHHCMTVIKEKLPGTQLDEGICTRLSKFAKRWK